MSDCIGRNSCPVCKEEWEALQAEIVRMRDALQTIADAPRVGYVPSGYDCGNSGDIYLDGEEAGLRHCAEIAKNALAKGGTQ